MPAPPQTPLQALGTLPAASAGAAAAKLDIRSTTGSALNLTTRETPATVNFLSETDNEERGARGLVETFRLVPLVVVGNNPGEVAANVTRGFHNANGFSIDGSRVADPVFLGRDYNSFLFDRVEVLKGPASVVSGTSGLAGSFNIITKQATTERTFTEGMVGYGSFDTIDTGVGLNVALRPFAAFRSTFGNDLGARTWRVGTTYDLFPGTTLFAQYAEATTPVSSALRIASASNVSFKLTTGNTIEAGVKSRMFGGSVTTTASIYEIEQADILTRDPARPSVVVQGGSQRSCGVEVETAISLTKRWNVSLSGTIINTEFTEVTDSRGNRLTGNRPVGLLDLGLQLLWRRRPAEPVA